MADNIGFFSSLIKNKQKYNIKDLETIPTRNYLFKGEDEFFKQNPNIAGMAAEDNNIILNPYTYLSKEQQQSVVKNEATRIFLRKNKIIPTFDLSEEQEKVFSSYSDNAIDIKHTIVGRIVSGDSSSLATDEQKNYVEGLFSRQKEIYEDREKR